MFILSLFAGAVIGLAPIQQQQTNYSRVIQHPDPTNGYDDFVRASDVVHSVELP